jgi:hypothetical protein
VVAVAFAAAVTGAAGAPSALPQQSGTVDLLSQANLQVDGAAVNQFAAITIATAGDVNGDGRSDIVLGTRSESAYVLFGRIAPGTVDLSALGDGGFRIDGEKQFDSAGSTVAGVGDVSGDGRADLLVGAPFADPSGRAEAGSAYVVFGKTSTTTVALATLGDGGFRIDGAVAGDSAGASVAAAGDVNGDTRPDLVVGAFRADNNGRLQSGSTYVVFGKTSTSPVDLAVLGGGGYRIDGAAPEDESGETSAGAGDVNGDGRPDVLVGAPGADNSGRATSGSVYVVFGKTSPETVDLANLAGGGYRIDGAAADDAVGTTIAGVGDTNGDGRRDVLIGSPRVDTGAPNSGAAYVVFGKPSTTAVDLGTLGGSGFRIDGGAAGDAVGLAVAAGGDVNGDGRSDLLIGSGATNNGRANAGSTYVVYGRTSTANVSLATLGAGVLRIDGAAANDFAGGAVASAGDVNGDGRTDVLVGAAGADNNGRTFSGSAYVVYGFGEPRLAYAPLQAQVGKAIEEQRPSQLARTGTPSFRVSPPLPSGLKLEGLGVISGTPTEAQARTTHRVTMTDVAGEVTAELVVTVSPPPDTTPPGLVLRAVSPQPASKRGDVRVRASCDEPCALRATGQVVIAGGSKLKLTQSTATLARAGAKTLVLRLSAAGKRRLAAASADGRGARASVIVRALDTAGNLTTRAASVRAR